MKVQIFKYVFRSLFHISKLLVFISYPMLFWILGINNLMEFVEFLLKHEMSINQNTVFIFFIQQFYEASTHMIGGK